MSQKSKENAAGEAEAAENVMNEKAEKDSKARAEKDDFLAEREEWERKQLDK